jgi:hypothetical protein
MVKETLSQILSLPVDIEMHPERSMKRNVAILTDFRNMVGTLSTREL